MPEPIIKVRYAGKPETPIYQSRNSNRVVNKILLGTWAGVVEEGTERDRVVTAGPDGWIKHEDTRDDTGLKVFFIDVGQGDAMLVEAPGKRILIDGGPNSNLRRYLRGWQYRYLLDAGAQVEIDTVFVSHFDYDHYNGLISLIKDPDFTFGTIYHNGIARFHDTASQRPPGHNTDLGRLENGLLRTTFDDLDDARDLLAAGGLQATFRNFLQAAVDAHDANRLERIRRLTSRDETVPGYRAASGLHIAVLGPVPSAPTGLFRWPWFEDSSHTRNGHSLVLKLSYDGANGRSVMLGGDLNAESERYLLDHYAPGNPFEVDVAKSCHHGSGDFATDFLAALNPFATIISSGDNESYAHPRADTVGSSGKYSRGDRPLVFSTELARSINSGGDILFGMINCRTDGERIVLAQMKERRTGSDVWDSYTV